MSTQRLGIFGGAFDPPHVGHLFIANAVASQAKLDRVLFEPVGNPAHRTASAPASARKAMVMLAIQDNPILALDDTALLQTGPVFTADTMPLLRNRYPDAQLCFIAGADSLLDTPWRRLDEVARALHCFYVVSREGADPKRLEPTLASLPEQLAKRFVLLQLPLVDVSASVIRTRIERGQPIRYLVPDAVAQYIEEHRLYGEKSQVEESP